MEFKPEETKSWGRVLREATILQVEEREMDDFERTRRTPGRIHLSKGDGESENAV